VQEVVEQLRASRKSLDHIRAMLARRMTVIDVKWDLLDIKTELLNIASLLTALAQKMEEMCEKS